MSNHAITWAYKLTGIKPGPKFVLVTIANYANDDGECFPSIDTIARDCGMHRSTVINAIKHLEEAGLISVFHRGGEGDGRKSNVYRVEYQSDSKVANNDQLSRELLLAKSENATKGKVANNDQLSRNLHGAKSQNPTLTTKEPNNTERQPIKPAKKVNKTVSFRAWPKPPPEDWWAEILVFRKAKRLSNTQRAIDLLGKELHKAIKMGYSYEKCLEIWEHSQWGGFRAEYLKGPKSMQRKNNAEKESWI